MADGQKSLMHKMRDSKPYMIFEMVMMAGMFSMWALGPAGFFTNMATGLWSGLQHVPAALATMGQGALNLAHGAGFLTSVNLPAGLADSWLPAATNGAVHATAAATTHTMAGGITNPFAAAAQWMAGQPIELQREFTGKAAALGLPVLEYVRDFCDITALVP